MLVVILWMGNLVFWEGDDGYVIVFDQFVVDFLVYFFEVDLVKFVYVIIICILILWNGEVIELFLNVVQVMVIRDVLVKVIYNNLFDWIVEWINQFLKVR